MPDLLIITQKVDRDEQLLGFFVEWIQRFASRFDKVTVLCLQKGSFSFPGNVKVIGLGKDEKNLKVIQLFNFYKNIFSLKYDAVFVHMNPIWSILGGPFWKLSGKKHTLWYAHGHVSRKLKLAEKFADIIFTSTPEGCRIDSSKIRVVGQGINTDLFKPAGGNPAAVFKIISVGRLSPSKDYETLLDALGILQKEGKNFRVDIVGGPGNPEDSAYRDKIQGMAESQGLKEGIKFLGAVPNREAAALLQKSDLFVNMGQTGSLDKAVLEAMACGLPVLTCNEAYGGALGALADKLMYPKKDASALAGKIAEVMAMTGGERTAIGGALRKIVVEHHNIDGLIGKIISLLISDGK